MLSLKNYWRDGPLDTFLCTFCLSGSPTNMCVLCCAKNVQTKIKSWSLVINDAQKLNNILYSFNTMVKILPQHVEIEQNRERLVEKIQHC